MGTPKISIIMPTRNRERFIHQAIESCLAQTLADLELVVVDDASTDATPAIVGQFADPRIRYIRQEAAKGSVACINQGMVAARGKYLTWISDDDYYEPIALEVMAQALDADPAVGFVYAQYAMVDEAGVFLRDARVEESAGLDRDNCVGHCFLYRRRVYEEVGEYHPEPFLAEEYEYWLRVRRKFVMRMIGQRLFSHRLHGGGLTLTHGVIRMEDAVAAARRPFIPAWKHWQLIAGLSYHRKRRYQALGRIAAALALNPLQGPSWRLLALLLLPSGVTSWIRRSCVKG